MLELVEMKKHLRLSHSEHDDIIEEHMSWAEDQIQHRVGIEDEDVEDFKDDPVYRRLKVMLTTHAYFNPQPYLENITFSPVTLGVASDIALLQYKYRRFKDNEN